MIKIATLGKQMRRKWQKKDAPVEFIKTVELFFEE